MRYLIILIVLLFGCKAKKTLSEERERTEVVVKTVEVKDTVFMPPEVMIETRVKPETLLVDRVVTVRQKDSSGMALIRYWKNLANELMIEAEVKPSPIVYRDTCESETREVVVKEKSDAKTFRNTWGFSEWVVLGIVLLIVLLLSFKTLRKWLFPM